MKDVIISNKKHLQKLKQIIKKQGKEKFHVLVDFDRTLTKAFVNGEKFPSLMAILRDGNYLTKNYAKKANALFDKYHPIEIHPHIPDNKKIKKMKEWWTTHFKLLIKSGLNKEDLKQVSRSSKVQLRKGTEEFLKFLHKNNIPLVILSSSGAGDIIPMFLKRKGLLYDNIHIISNFFEYDKKGKVTRIIPPIIHCMNKAEIAVKNYSNIFNQIRNRKNVLLLGDGIGDIGMIKGFDYNNLINIGFLNENVKENLKYFKKNFDIVLLNDTNMAYINKLLKEIIT